jgi:uncharacterized membrane protein
MCDPTPELGPHIAGFSCGVVVVSTGAEPARGSSTGVIGVVRNSMGDSQCGRAGCVVSSDQPAD